MDRSIPKFAAGATTFLGWVALAATAGAAETWNMATVLPSGNFQLENAQRFADAVAEATGGEVTITIHAGGSLGYKGPELLVAVRDGLVEIADIQMNQQIGEDPFFGIESLPFLATGYEDLGRLQAITRPYFDEIAQSYNQKLLYVTPWPPQNVFANAAVTDDLAAFEEMTIRTIDKNATDFFNELGATAVQMPWGEVIPALASGAIDAVSTSSTSAVDGTFWEFMTDYNQLQWQMNSQMVTVNLDAWNRLSPEHQTAIEAIAAEMEPEFRDASMAEDARNIATLNDNGMVTNLPSDAVKARLREIGTAYWDDFIDSVGPRAEEVISAYMAETEAVAAQ